MGATLHTFLDLSVLMIELLPVLGYPMNPTLYVHEVFLYLQS